MKLQLPLAILFSSMMVCSIALKGQTTGEIFLNDTAPEKLFDNGVGWLLEGPAMSEEGEVYFCDIFTPENTAGVIWKCNPETGKAEVFRSPSGMAAGLMFDSQGRLVVCELNTQRVTRTDLKTGLSEILASKFEDEPFNAPNDVAIDEQGNIYFTDSKLVGDNFMTQKVHGIYRIDTTGNVELVIAGYGKPNGISISPDQATIYISTSDNVRTNSDFKGAKPDNTGKLIAFNLHEDGSVTFREELVDLGYMADGITVDAEGNIYVATISQKKLVVYSSLGKMMDEIEFPEGALVSNASFGRGKYSSTLFVTSGKHLYAVKTKKTGYHLPLKNKLE